MPHNDSFPSVAKELELLKKTLATHESRIAILEQGIAVPEPVVRIPEQKTKKKMAGVTQVSEKEDARHDAPKKKDNEQVFGAYYLSRIGMVGLLLGIGYLLKYSFDTNIIGPFGRIMIGYLAALGLFGIGEWYRKKFPTWSRVFTGGALVTAYFATYAAQQFYGLFSLPVTITIMTFITACGALLAIHYKSQLIFLFAIIGGFVTPLMMSGIGQSDALLQLYYIVVLNLGVLYVSRYAGWYLFYPLASMMTFFFFGAVYQDVSLVVALSFLTVYFSLFLGSILLHVKTQLALLKQTVHTTQHVSQEISVEQGSIVFTLLSHITFFYAMLYTLLHSNYMTTVGLIGFLLAVCFFMVGTYLAFYRSLQHVSVSLTASAIALFVAAIAVTFDAAFLEPLWAIFAGVLLYYYRVVAGSEKAVFQRIGLIVLLVSCIYSLEPLLFDTLHFFSQSFFSTIIPTLVLFFASGIYLSEYNTANRTQHRELGTFLFYAAHVFIIVLFSRSIYGAFSLSTQRDLAQFGVSLFLIGYSLLWLVFGFLKHVKLFRITGLIGFGLTVFKVLLFDLSSVAIVYRMIACVVIGIILIFASYLYQRSENQE